MAQDAVAPLALQRTVAGAAAAALAVHQVHVVAAAVVAAAGEHEPAAPRSPCT